MLFDFQTSQKLSNYDVCIAGGGPAGITLALQLAGQGLRVALLEGGGLEYSEASQALYEVEVAGNDMYAATTRQRYFGGTSNHWSGRCRPFERADFTTRPPTGMPGWPIPFEAIQHYLPAAMRILDLPAQGFAAINADMPGGNFPADRFALSSPTRFGEKYLAAIKSSANLHLILNCNLVDLIYEKPANTGSHNSNNSNNINNKNGAIKHAVVANFAGKRANLTAGRFVLAMGAIETARLMLNSQSLRTAGLEGFQWVGRCLMEHLNVELGSFMPAEGLQADDLQYFTSDALVTREGIGRGNIAFGLLKEVQSYGRTAAVKSFMKNLACDLGMADKLQFISTFQCPGAGTIGTLLEQFPSARGSRVELIEARDSLGLRKARVTWTLSPEDKKTIRRLALAVAKNFASAGLGFIKLHPAMTDATLDIPLAPHAHHMGTTRMAQTAAAGVVDANCQVFGVNNLYVAGSSVFPTGGGNNPTMPMLQLALRLADHLLQNTPPHKKTT